MPGCSYGVWELKDSPLESVLSFHHVGPEGTLILRLDCKSLYSVSLLASPL